MTTHDETPATGRVRPFADFLREHSRGRTHDEMSSDLRDLTAKVIETGKKGSLTLVITVEPMKGDGKAVVVHDEIKVKLPEHDRPASVFFADRDHNLVRNDPRQMHLPIASVPPPPGVNLQTGEIDESAANA